MNIYYDNLSYIPISKKKKYSRLRKIVSFFSTYFFRKLIYIRAIVFKLDILILK